MLFFPPPSLPPSLPPSFLSKPTLKHSEKCSYFKSTSFHPSSAPPVVSEMSSTSSVETSTPAASVVSQVSFSFNSGPSFPSHLHSTTQQQQQQKQLLVNPLPLSVASFTLNQTLETQPNHHLYKQQQQQQLPLAPFGNLIEGHRQLQKQIQIQKKLLQILQMEQELLHMMMPGQTDEMFQRQIPVYKIQNNSSIEHLPSNTAPQSIPPNIMPNGAKNGETTNTSMSDSVEMRPSGADNYWPPSSPGIYHSRTFAAVNVTISILLHAQRG